MIGVHLNWPRVTELLASVLLTDAELAARQSEWVTYPTRYRLDGPAHPSLIPTPRKVLGGNHVLLSP